MKAKHYPLIVIGSGAAGLVVAIGAARAGKKVLLIEKGNYGGDCTNFGCIPSKSLIASARAAHNFHTAHELGVALPAGQVNSRGALARLREIVSDIRRHEDPEALSKFGIATITGTARFQDPHTLFIPETSETVTGKQIVIATGSHPAIPSIAGIEDVPYLTNETIFQLEDIPRHLAILGGGPVGCELAQAFRRLGAEVTLIEQIKHLLIREEPESQKIIEQIFHKEGIRVIVGEGPKSIRQHAGEIILSLSSQEVQASHLLIAVGRQANVDSLHLEAAGLAASPQGIQVEAYGRTSQPHIWAAGDVTGPPFFTHWAEHSARCILFNLLAPWPFRRKIPALNPSVVFTDPEVASIGLTEAQARQQYGSWQLATYQVPFTKIDRAITAGRTEGFVKIITKRWSSHILGATIVGPRAGEMLMEIATAMAFKIPLRKLANVIHPYPTYNLAIRKAADQWLTKTLFFWKKSS